MSLSVQADLLNGFLIATRDVLAEVDNISGVKPGKPRIKAQPFAPGLLTGVVDLGGEQLSGCFALTFTHAFTQMLCGRLLVDHVRAGGNLGELAETTAGDLCRDICLRAGELLANREIYFQMASPRGYIGDDYRIYHGAATPVIQVPFLSSWGGFSVESSFRVMEASMTDTTAVNRLKVEPSMPGNETAAGNVEPSAADEAFTELADDYTAEVA